MSDQQEAMREEFEAIFRDQTYLEFKDGRYIPRTNMARYGEAVLAIAERQNCRFEGWQAAAAQYAEKIARLEISYALYSAEENLIWELMPELRNTDSQYELHEAVHEKIARLEAEKREIQKLCEHEANEKARYKSLLKTSSTEAEVLLRGEVAGLIAKLAAAELSNKQKNDALLAAQEFIRNGVALGFIRMPDADCPDPAHKVPGMIAEALAQQPSTEALDAYVAGKLPAWQPISTVPKDGTEIIIHAVRAGGTFIAKWDVDFRGWIVSKGTWVSGPSHWMPLPPAPEQKG